MTSEIDAWLRAQAVPGVLGPRLRELGWTTTDAEVEAILAAAESSGLARWSTAGHLAEWGEDFARNVARLGGVHVGQGETGDEFWVAGPPGAAKAEIKVRPRAD